MYRIIQNNLTSQVKNINKVLLLIGARQVGKTTLLNNSFPKALFLNIEKGEYTDIFNSRNTLEIKNIIKRNHNCKILILDEVQRLDDPGLVAKVIHDEIPEVKLIISGSSSLEIANKASESLAGRKITFLLYPLTLKEKLVQKKLLENISDNEKEIMIPVKKTKKFSGEILTCLQYGLYPETMNTTEPEKYLLELVESNLLKDVYYLNLVKNTKNLLALLKLLAYQIGQQVNITELSGRIGIARETVIDYLEIFKKLYIVYTLAPFTKKRRDEIGKTEKIYFYDLGLRNAIINDFSPVEYRVDFGSIFENFVVSELMKLNSYYSWRYNFNYWRTKWGSEVDLVLSRDEEIIALELKTRKGKVTHAFLDTYKEAQSGVITLDNVESILL